MDSSPKLNRELPEHVLRARLRSGARRAGLRTVGAGLVWIWVGVLLSLLAYRFAGPGAPAYIVFTGPIFWGVLLILRGLYAYAAPDEAVDRAAGPPPGASRPVDYRSVHRSIFFGVALGLLAGPLLLWNSSVSWAGLLFGPLIGGIAGAWLAIRGAREAAQSAYQGQRHVGWTTAAVAFVLLGLFLGVPNVAREPAVGMPTVAGFALLTAYAWRRNGDPGRRSSQRVFLLAGLAGLAVGLILTPLLLFVSAPGRPP